MTEKVRLSVEGVGDVEVEKGKKLVLALREDAGIDQLHACGGKAKCTTCKVEIVEGEPRKITVAEKSILEERGIQGVRLSCQILCEEDMKVKAVSLLEGSGRADCGTMPPEEIIPEPEWNEI